jgi:hypothetical protein
VTRLLRWIVGLGAAGLVAAWAIALVHGFSSDRELCFNTSHKDCGASLAWTDHRVLWLAPLLLLGLAVVGVVAAILGKDGNNRTAVPVMGAGIIGLGLAALLASNGGTTPVTRSADPCSGPRQLSDSYSAQVGADESVTNPPLSDTSCGPDHPFCTAPDPRASARADARSVALRWAELIVHHSACFNLDDVTAARAYIDKTTGAGANQ